MKKTELAKLLNISGSMVSRLARKGMPTDSLDRAQRWRRRHLETGRMKGIRYDPSRPRGQAPPQPDGTGAEGEPPAPVVSFEEIISEIASRPMWAMRPVDLVAAVNRRHALFELKETAVALGVFDAIEASWQAAMAATPGAVWQVFVACDLAASSPELTREEIFRMASPDPVGQADDADQEA